MGDNNVKNILIVTGGRVDMAFAALWLNKTQVDFVIAADRGGEKAMALDLDIDLLIGDMDSVRDAQAVKLAAKETFIYPSQKDDTDTALALKAALEKKPENIFILGGTGDRLDHTFTTVFSLIQTLDAGVNCEIIDEKNRIYIKNRDFCIHRSEQFGDFVTFVPITQRAVLSIEGMKYNGTGINVLRGSSLCQSNEVADDVAYVNVHEGTVLVFESRD